MHITFKIVDNFEATRAFEWHRAFAQSHDAIYPRDVNAFGTLVYQRSVWSAVTPDGEIQALSYADFSEAEYQWEIGGLMVAEEMRGKGLGSIMMRLPLIHMLFNEQPLDWDPVPAIVAHVLSGNEAPRTIIPSVGFAWAKAVAIAEQFLPGLKADPDGYVRGDEFHLQIPDGLLVLAQWCDGWNGKLLDGTDASIDLLDGLTVADWTIALREMAQ